MAYTYSFDLVRETVTREMILAHYGLKPTVQGRNLRSICPIHEHTGEPNPTALSVKDDWVFQCFVCNASGKGAVRFVQLAEKLADKLDALKVIYGWFGLGNGNGHVAPAKPQEAQAATEPARNIPLKEKAKLAGKDWDGTLKLEYHPYLDERGFSKELCATFGVGYTSKGFNAGRIAFPIHNPAGELVGYGGRLVDEKIAWRPKDKDTKKPIENFTPPRWQNPPGFQTHLELFNLHRVITQDFDTAIVCESFWGPLAFMRAGIKNAVATMGKHLSDEQAALLGHFRHVILMFDGTAREESAKAGAKLLTRNFESVKVVFLPDDEEWAQPDRIAPENLYEMF